MANEISCRVKLTVNKVGASVDMDRTKFITMNGFDMSQVTQEFTSVGTAINLGNVSGVPKKVVVVNNNFPVDPLSTADDILIGATSDVTGFTLRVGHGDSCIFEPSTATLYAKSTGTTVRAQIIAVEQ